MARIQTYTPDKTVEKSDRLLGSNVDGTTKNFSIEDISKFLKETNAAGVAGQLTYKYETDSTKQTKGTAYINGNSPLAFSSVTTIRVNKYRNGDEINSIENLLETFQGNDIIINDTDDLDNFGIYACSDITRDASTDFWTITLPSVRSSQGNFTVDKIYSIAIYSVAGDKNDVFSEEVIQFLDRIWGKVI